MASEAFSSIPATQLDNFLDRLESRPKPILCHEFGGGSRCTRCDCPGLDLHFWRKICKICFCRLDEHDIRLPDDQDQGALITRKLFSQINYRYPETGSTSTGSMGERGTGSDRSSSSASTVSPKMSSKWKLEDGIGRLKLGTEGKENGNRIKDGNNKESNDISDGENRIGMKLAGQIPHINNYSKPQSLRKIPPPPLPSSPPPVNLNAPIHAIYENNLHIKNDNVAKGFGQNREDWVWTPSADWPFALRYLLSLNADDRPLKGTGEGQLRRRQRLAQQLPYHDSDVAASKANVDEREQKLHKEFIELVKREIVGIAEIVDLTEHKMHFALPNGKNVEPNCRQCSSKFDPQSVGVVTDHESDKIDAIWHPRCFVCSICNELLVDLLYFFRDGKYYCGRHFGEKLYPRCAGCDELIFSREYTFAEEKSWHLEHFCCFGCDSHLCGKRYVVKEEQPFCVDCYMQKFARTCLTCCHKIAPFDQRVTYGQLHWHAGADCFKCRNCSKPLSNQQFLLQNDQPFCGGECKMSHELGKNEENLI